MSSLVEQIERNQHMTAAVDWERLIQRMAGAIPALHCCSTETLISIPRRCSALPYLNRYPCAPTGSFSRA